MQISGVSLKVFETETKVTKEVIKKYRNNCYNSAMTCTREILSQIDNTLAESRPRKKEE